jgi:hypothetical protein
MTTIYEVIEKFGGETIKRINSDGTETWIPTDPANSDYQRYLRWLENPDAEENGTIS